MLKLDRLTKAFGSAVVVNEVSLEIGSGEIHSLVGENGAGKSTLIKMLSGALAPNAGVISLDSQPIFLHSPLEAKELGISAVFQELDLVPTISIAENIVIGRYPMSRGRIDWGKAEEHAAALLAELGITIDTRRRLDECSVAIRQLVAIARALDNDSNLKLMILDEPTSSIDSNEVQHLFRVLKRLRDRGLSIIFVSHFLDQVFEISNRISAMRNGSLVGSYEATDIGKEELVQEMLGRQLSLQHPMAFRQPQTGVPALEAEGIGRKGEIGPVSIRVERAEAVGLAGLLGSGRTSVMRMLFGLDRIGQGTVKAGGQRLKLKSTMAAIKARIALVPQDRKMEGIFAQLSVRENIVAGLQARAGWLRKISRKRQQEIARRYVESLHIDLPGIETPAGLLSGGNQQKVLLARWLALNPAILLLDEPTRGVDVGAKEQIERLIAKLCEEGMAALMVGTDIEEMCRTSHRVVVMRAKKSVAELANEEISIERLAGIMAEGHG